MTSCSIYVDLNELRRAGPFAGGIAVLGHLPPDPGGPAAAAAASREDFGGEDPEGLYEFSKSAAEALYADCWLSPITADGPLLTADSLRVDSPPAGSSRIPVILSRPRSDTPPTPVDEEGVVPAAENRGGNEEAPCLCPRTARHCRLPL